MKTKNFRKNHCRQFKLMAILVALLFAVPVFADVPVHLLVCKEKGYTLNSTANASGGSEITYTWYVSVDGGDFSAVESSNTASISVGANTKDPGTYSYVRKAVNTECSGGVYSNTYTVVVLKPAAPVIVAPESAVCANTDVTFTIAPADNTTYTWSGATGTPSGTDNSTYTFSSATYGTIAVQAAASVTYTVGSLEKTCVSDLSTTANATVNPLPVISNTTTLNACGSGAKALSVQILVASAEPESNAISIRWYSDAAGETAIEGATNASYTTPVLTATETYYVGATVNSSGCTSDGLTTVSAIVNLYEGVISGTESSE